jgi:hypothetical protein
MTKLWQALEDAPLIMEVAGVWRERLGKEFESLHRLFITTNIFASSIRFPGDRTYWRVIDEGHRVIAFNPELGEHREIGRPEARLCRFDVRRFASELCKSMGWTPRFEMLSNTYHVTRIGVLPASLNSLPVYLCIRSSLEDFLSAVDVAAKHAIGPYLFVTPTDRIASAELQAWLHRTAGRQISLDQLLRADLKSGTNAFIANKDATPAIQRLLGLEVTETPRYQFKLVGSKHRYVAFDSDPSIVSESPGMKFIAELLALPHQSIHATQLEAMRSGINAVASTGSLGTKIDAEANRSYARRLQEINAEIGDAGSFVSERRLEELYYEKESIIDTVRAATQRGGELRVDSDADRARQSVSTAIRRAIKAIAKEHASMADYLDRNISLGFEIRYTPPTPLDWHL